MKTGPMPISEFEAIISRNIYERCGGFSFHSANAGGGARKGIATDTTLVIGNPAVGEWHNVSVPTIPEKSTMVWNPNIGRPQYIHGWRGLLTGLITDGTIRLGDDIRRALGSQAADQIKQDLWRAKYEDPDEIYWKTKQIPSVA